MQIIELEKYQPSLDDPHRLEYAGQRTGREVFAELKQRLENAGLLPVEYFLIGREWEHGEDIPKGADLFVTTDYGGSEGCYLDIYLKWYEDNKPVTKNFATSRTAPMRTGNAGQARKPLLRVSISPSRRFSARCRNWRRRGM